MNDRVDGLGRPHVAAWLKPFGVTADEADRICDVARQYGQNSIPVSDGIVDIFFNGKTFGFLHGNSVATGKSQSRNSLQTVAPGKAGHYTQPNPLRNNQGGRRMAGRTKAQTAVVEPEEDEQDLTTYADKEATDTMVEFANWIVEFVYGGEYPGGAKAEDEFRNGVRLGGTLRMIFQASDWWHERREELKAEKAAAREEAAREKAAANGKADKADDDAATEKAGKPARGRGAAKGATGAGKTAATGKATGTKPRGRAASSGEAPY